MCCYYTSEISPEVNGCYYNAYKPVNDFSNKIEMDLTGLGLGKFDPEAIEEVNNQMTLLAMETASEPSSEANSNSFKRMGSVFFDPNLSFANNYLQANQISSYAQNVNSHLKRFGSQFDSNPTQSLIDKVPSCPVNVPLCRRDPCEPSNPDLEQDAFGCTNVPGCCFDMNLWLYKNWFGLYKEVPACYRSIKSPVYYDYIQKFSTWRPEWGIFIAKTFEKYDRNNTNMWGYNQKCPNNQHWSVTVAQSLYQRVTTIMSSQQAAQTNSGPMTALLNPLGFHTLNIVKKLTSDLNQVTQQIVDRLSGDCGWSDISRFECQMQGCCWQPDAGADPLDSDRGRCIKHFDMNDYTDDEKFIKAISHALSDGSEDDSSDSTSDPSKAIVPNFGGNLPIGNYQQNSYGNMFGNSGYQAQPSPFAGMFGRRRRRSPEPFFGSFGQSYRNQRQTTQTQPRQTTPFGGMPGMGQQNMPQTPMNMFGNNFNRNPRDEVLLEANPFNANNPIQTIMANMNINTQDPSAMMAMAMMTEGKSSEDIMKTILQQQKMEQLKKYTEEINPPACPMIKPDRKRQCGSYTGNMKNDLNTCQARGCCFDVEAWHKLDDEAEAEKEQQTQSQTNSILQNKNQEVDDSTPPWMRNGLASGGFGPSNPQIPTFNKQKSSNPFAGRFGRKRRSPEPQNPFMMNNMNQPTGHFSRSMVNVNPNPFLPEQFQVAEVCTWENPFDGKHNLAKLEPVFKQCCEQVMCYHAESSANWAAWADWSLCPVSCNGGERKRVRNCVDGDNIVDVSLCKGRADQSDRCNTHSCPEMKAWSNWSTCSTTCGQGQRMRTRTCSHNGLCQGQATNDSEPCKIAHCMSEWSDWGACDKMCGTGMQIRGRHCIEMAGTCNASDEQNRPCNTQFCESWAEWSGSGFACEPIDRPCGKGRQRLTRSCDGGEIGSPGCNPSDGTFKYAQCDLEACPMWSNWGTWSECQKTMKYGTVRQRTRVCPIENACGMDNPIDMQGCFGGWTAWSNCGWSSKTSSRSRYCKSTKFQCIGDKRETMSCTDKTQGQPNQSQGYQNQQQSQNSQTQQQSSGGYATVEDSQPQQNNYGGQNYNTGQSAYSKPGYASNSNSYRPFSNTYGSNNRYQSNGNGYNTQGGGNSANSYGAMGSYGNKGGSQYGNQMSFYNNKRPTSMFDDPDATYSTNPLQSVNNNAWKGLGSNFFG